MKSIRTKLAGAAAAALLTAGAAQAGIVVSFTPSSQHVMVGESILVDLVISGLGDEILSAADFDALWDPAIAGGSFSFDWTEGVAELGGNWGIDPNWQTNIDTIVGEYSVRAWAWDTDDDNIAANQSNSFVLTKIKLTGLADGVTWIGLGSEPDYQRNFVGRNFGTLDVTVQGACIAVGDAQCSTVPEPATYALAALAFAGALGARRRRRD